METKEIVAIKKVLQDKGYKNRELQVLKDLVHPNIINLKHYFYTNANNKVLIVFNDFYSLMKCI